MPKLSHMLQKQFDNILSHLYVNPLEKCNLRCKICYTRKTSPILKEEEILRFIRRYSYVHKVETVTFCGGEVFTLPYFPKIVNHLTAYPFPSRIVTKDEVWGGDIFVQIITNGTVDKLVDFINPNMVNLIVSIDGLESYHDSNRGKGNFRKSLSYLKKARDLGFHTEVFSVATKENYRQMGEFEKYLKGNLGNIRVTYHPRKPPLYLLHHPVSNIFGEIGGFDFLTERQMVEIMDNKRTFPPKKLGCYQIALTSDGKVYGCCEGTVPLGDMHDGVDKLVGKLYDRLLLWEEKVGKPKKCLGCSQPDFVCGIRKYISC